MYPLSDQVRCTQDLPKNPVRCTPQATPKHRTRAACTTGCSTPLGQIVNQQEHMFTCCPLSLPRLVCCRRSDPARLCGAFAAFLHLPVAPSPSRALEGFSGIKFLRIVLAKSQRDPCHRAPSSAMAHCSQSTPKASTTVLPIFSSASSRVCFRCLTVALPQALFYLRLVQCQSCPLVQSQESSDVYSP